VAALAETPGAAFSEKRICAGSEPVIFARHERMRRAAGRRIGLHRSLMPDVRIRNRRSNRPRSRGSLLGKMSAAQGLKLGLGSRENMLACSGRYLPGLTPRLGRPAPFILDVDRTASIPGVQAPATSTHSRFS
jgi:hypothetical protein